MHFAFSLIIPSRVVFSRAATRVVVFPPLAIAISRAARLILSRAAHGVLVPLDAFVSRSHVVTLSLIIIAKGGVFRENGYVRPMGRMPVRVIVALFRAFVTATISVGILSRVNRRAVAETVVATKFLIGGEEALVALAHVALVVPLVRLLKNAIGLNPRVASIHEVAARFVEFVRSLIVLRARVETVAKARVLVEIRVVFLAHVLENEVAVELVRIAVLVSAAAVLIRPLDRVNRLAFARAPVQFVGAALEEFLKKTR